LESCGLVTHVRRNMRFFPVLREKRFQRRSLTLRGWHMNDGTALAACQELEIPADLQRLEQILIGEQASPESCCKELTKIFSVRDSEIALLGVRGNLLRFLYPVALRSAGTIPISGSAIAARTALTKKPEIFNSFTKVRHISIFESIKLRDAENGDQSDPQVIQKLMSVPVLDDGGRVCGILQISRKGHDLNSCGPDFTPEELRRLGIAARIIGTNMSLLN